MGIRQERDGGGTSFHFVFCFGHGMAGLPRISYRYGIVYHDAAEISRFSFFMLFQSSWNWLCLVSEMYRNRSRPFRLAKCGGCYRG